MYYFVPYSLKTLDNFSCLIFLMYVFISAPLDWYLNLPGQQGHSNNEPHFCLFASEVLPFP